MKVKVLMIEAESSEVRDVMGMVGAMPAPGWAISSTQARRLSFCSGCQPRTRRCTWRWSSRWKSWTSCSFNNQSREGGAGWFQLFILAR